MDPSKTKNRASTEKQVPRVPMSFAGVDRFIRDGLGVNDCSLLLSFGPGIYPASHRDDWEDLGVNLLTL